MNRQLTSRYLWPVLCSSAYFHPDLLLEDLGHHLSSLLFNLSDVPSWIITRSSLSSLASTFFAITFLQIALVSNRNLLDDFLQRKR